MLFEPRVDPVALHADGAASADARVSEFPPTRGNDFELLPDYGPALDRLAADIEGATRSVHLLYYIFAPDDRGRAMAESGLPASR